MSALTRNYPPFGSIQTMAAGVNFNGAEPAAYGAVEERMRSSLANAANGGLFDFTGLHATVLIDQIRLHLTGGSGYTLSIVRKGGSATDRIATASGLTDVHLFWTTPIILSPGEKLHVVTTGAAGGNVAYCQVLHRLWNRVSDN